MQSQTDLCPQAGPVGTVAVEVWLWRAPLLYEATLQKGWYVTVLALDRLKHIKRWARIRPQRNGQVAFLSKDVRDDRFLLPRTTLYCLGRRGTTGPLAIRSSSDCATKIIRVQRLPIDCRFITSRTGTSGRRSGDATAVLAYISRLNRTIFARDTCRTVDVPFRDGSLEF